MTNWRRERWRKLFVREPLEQQAWPWQARGLRDLFIRTAEDDGMVARSLERLRLALHVAPGDAVFDACVREMLDDGFLVENELGVWVRNLPAAQGDGEPAAMGDGDNEPVPPNETPEERRRRKARLRTRKRRASRDGVTERDGIANASVTGSVTERDGIAPSSSPLASPLLLPTSQNKQPEKTEAAAARVTERDGQRDTERDSNANDSVTGRDAKALVPCPENLTLTDAQRRTLETGMIPGWAIDTLTLGFVSSAVAGTEVRTVEVWRKCLSRAITGGWNDQTRRPKPPEGNPVAPRRVAIPVPSVRPMGPILDGPPPDIAEQLAPRRPPVVQVRSREEQLEVLRAEAAKESIGG